MARGARRQCRGDDCGCESVAYLAGGARGRHGNARRRSRGRTTTPPRRGSARLPRRLSSATRPGRRNAIRNEAVIRCAGWLREAPSYGAARNPKATFRPVTRQARRVRYARAVQWLCSRTGKSDGQGCWHEALGAALPGHHHPPAHGCRFGQRRSVSTCRVRSRKQRSGRACSR